MGERPPQTYPVYAVAPGSVRGSQRGPAGSANGVARPRGGSARRGTRPLGTVQARENLEDLFLRQVPEFDQDLAKDQMRHSLRFAPRLNRERFVELRCRHEPEFEGGFAEQPDVVVRFDTDVRTSLDNPPARALADRRGRSAVQAMSPGPSSHDVYLPYRRGPPVREPRRRKSSTGTTRNRTLRPSEGPCGSKREPLRREEHGELRLSVRAAGPREPGSRRCS